MQSQIRVLKKDDQGLFIKTNGATYRPVKQNYGHTIVYDGQWLEAVNETKISEDLVGQKIELFFYPHTPHIVVEGEVWTTDG